MTSGLHGDLRELFDRIEQAASLPALWKLIVRYFRREGFEASAYVMLERGRMGEALAFCGHGYPRGVLRTYAALGYGQSDALTRLALASGQPQLRSEVRKLARFSRDERRHTRLMQDLGVTELIAMPLYGPRGREGIGSLSRAEDDTLYRTANITKLHMVAQAAHLRACTLMPAPPHGGQELSLREVEILRWVAKGKSNGAIAEILSISSATVDTYLRRIYDKLGVADRTSAAVKGVSLGLVRVNNDRPFGR